MGVRGACARLRWRRASRAGGGASAKGVTRTTTAGVGGRRGPPRTAAATVAAPFRHGAWESTTAAASASWKSTSSATAAGSATHPAPRAECGMPAAAGRGEGGARCGVWVGSKGSIVDMGMSMDFSTHPHTHRTPPLEGDSPLGQPGIPVPKCSTRVYCDTGLSSASAGLCPPPTVTKWNARRSRLSSVQNWGVPQAGPVAATDPGLSVNEGPRQLSPH